jgi:hypothetical protein
VSQTVERTSEAPAAPVRETAASAAGDETTEPVAPLLREPVGSIGDGVLTQAREAAGATSPDVVTAVADTADTLVPAVTDGVAPPVTNVVDRVLMPVTEVPPSFAAPVTDLLAPVVDAVDSPVADVTGSVTIPVTEVVGVVNGATPTSRSAPLPATAVRPASETLAGPPSAMGPAAAASEQIAAAQPATVPRAPSQPASAPVAPPTHEAALRRPALPVHPLSSVPPTVRSAAAGADWPPAQTGAPPATEHVPGPGPSDTAAPAGVTQSAPAGTSSAGAAGGGGFSPALFAILIAAFATLAQAARTLPRSTATARSVSLVLLVERPG